MESKSDCIFCHIAAGQAPAERLYEDDTTVAFMDINPATDGHCLVIPKRHADNIWSLTTMTPWPCGGPFIGSLRWSGKRWKRRG